MTTHRRRLGPRATPAGTWFARQRTLRGMTQVECAELLGVRYLTALRWEHGRHFPQHRNVDAIARLFGVPPERVREEMVPR